MTFKKPSKTNRAVSEFDERTFHLMFERHAAIMLLIEPQTGSILDANQAAVNFYGYSKVQLCEMLIQEINILPPEQVAAERQKAFSEERNFFVFPHKLANGEERIVEVRSSPVDWKGKQVLFSIIHDITERRQAEEAHAKSEAMLKKVQEVTHMGSWEIDLNTRTVVGSDEAHRIYGVAQGLMTLDYIQSVPLPEFRPILDAALSALIAEGKRYDVEFKIKRHSDDEIRDIHSIAEYNATSRTIIGSVQDITERKRAEEALKKSEIWFKSLFEKASEGIFYLSLDGELVEVNDAFARMHGYSVEEMRKMRLSGLDTPETSRQFPERMQRIMAGEIFTFEVEHFHKDGHAFPLEVTTSMIVVGDERYVLAFHRDITERRRGEKALRESEALYRQAIEVANAVPYHQAYHVNGKSVDYDFIGEGIFQITGYRPEEFNESLWDALVQESMLLDDLAGYSWLEAVERVRSGISPVWRCNHRIRARDGSMHWVFEAAVELRDENGVSHGSIGMFQDITERKQAEESLATSEAKLRALVEQVPAIVYTESAETRETLYISPQVEKLTGYTPAEWINDINLWKKMIHAEDLAAVVAEDEHTTVTHEPFHVEYRILTRDGRTLWIYDEAVFVQNQDGTPLFWQGLMHDITERKQAEEGLRESEEKFVKVFRDAPVLIAITDMNTGTYVEVNEEALRVSGFTHEEVIGHTVAELGWISSKGRARLVKKVRDHGRIDGLEMEFHAKDGRLLHGWINGEQIVIGGRSCLLTVTIDITERKRAEEALRESQSLYHSLVEVSPLSICRKDLEGRFTFANKRFLELSHITLADLIGKTDFDLHPPELAEKYRRDEKAVLDSRQVWELIEERTLLSGQSSIVQSIKVPTYDGTGKINGVQTSFWDITDRKQTENQLRKLSRAVEQNPASIVITDLQGNIEYVNPKFSQVTGYSFEESIGKNPRILKSGNTTREEYKNMWDTILSGNVWQGELLNRKKNGETYWEFATITPVFGEDRKITNFLALKENITERKQAEEIIKTTNILLEQTLEQSPVPMVLVSMPDGIIRSANSACRSFLGVDDEPSPVGTKLSELKISWQDLDMQGNPGTFEELPLPRSLMGLKTDPQERRIVRKDGTSVHELAYGSPIFDAEGKVIAGYLVMIDITKRKRVEHDIHQRVMELETLNRISLVLRAVSKQEEMLSIVLDEALAILNTSHGSIELYNKTTNSLEKTITRGWITQITDKSQKSSEGIAGKVFTSGEIYISREFATDREARAAARSQMLPGWGGVCVPIRTTQQTLGVLLVSIPSERELNSDEIRLLATLSEMTGAALQRMQLHAQTVRRLEQLHALRAVDQAIASNLDMRLTLNILLDQTVSQLNVDAADVLLLPAGSSMLELTASRGFHSHLLGSINLSDSFALRAIMEHRILSAVDFEVSVQSLHFAKLWKEEGFVCYWCVPLIVKGEVKGILEVYCRKAFTPDADWLEFLEALAGQAAITIDTAQLFENLQRANLDLSLAYDATIEGWSRAMDLRDHETEGHTLRVTDLTLKLARAMRISESQLTAIRRGALLHDIGKMGVPDAILLKEGNLTEEEWVLMRRHPQLAQDMLAPISYLNDAIDIPYCHHEKWDGTGYPQGLKGERIPLIARIFAVVDVWDALTNDRTYRSKWAKQETIQYIKEQSGTHFDPQVVDIFLKHINIDA